MKASWEAFIQHFAICAKLLAIDDAQLQFSRDFQAELTECLAELQIEEVNLPVSEEGDEAVAPIQSTQLRQIKRDEAFREWTDLKSKGAGVQLFAECSSSNKWLYDRSGLSPSEWIAAIKMTAGVFPVRALPGRSNDGFHCRHCDSEYESMSHVLGFCQRGHLLRNARHHRVRTMIANALKQAGLSVFEEVPCNAADGSSKRVDIIAFDNKTRKGWVLDPTIRFENGMSQPLDVDAEKRAHYEPCTADLMARYKLTQIDVIGLFIGARGTLTKFVVNNLIKLGLTKKTLNDIVISVIKDSIKILNYHLSPVKN